jgi:hypothetical protein
MAIRSAGDGSVGLPRGECPGFSGPTRALTKLARALAKACPPKQPARRSQSAPPRSPRADTRPSRVYPWTWRARGPTRPATPLGPRCAAHPHAGFAGRVDALDGRRSRYEQRRAPGPRLRAVWRTPPLGGAARPRRPRSRHGKQQPKSLSESVRCRRIQLNPRPGCREPMPPVPARGPSSGYAGYGSCGALGRSLASGWARWHILRTMRLWVLVSTPSRPLGVRAR